METKLWYNVGMRKSFEKKTENLALKVADKTRQEVEEIAAHEDRPVGYVARELMIRGIALYHKDGRLRDEGSLKEVPVVMVPELNEKAA